MFTRPSTFLLLSTVLGATLLVGCKKEQQPPPAPVGFRPTFQHLDRAVETDPAPIPLLGADGSEVTLGQIATGRTVALVPWVAPQEDAQERIRSVMEALKDVEGVQILPVISQRDPTEAFLSDIMQQGQLMGLPYYVDHQVRLLPFINDHLRMRAVDRKIVTVPPFVLFTKNLRQIAIALPSTEIGEDAARLVEQSRMTAPTEPAGEASAPAEAAPSDATE